jgi:hypothetical protein
MKVLDGQAGPLDSAAEDSLADKIRRETNKESLDP